MEGRITNTRRAMFGIGRLDVKLTINTSIPVVYCMTVFSYTFIGYDEHELMMLELARNIDSIFSVRRIYYLCQETATQFMFLSPQDMRYEMCCRIYDHQHQSNRGFVGCQLELIISRLPALLNFSYLFHHLEGQKYWMFYCINHQFI